MSETQKVILFTPECRKRIIIIIGLHDWIVCEYGFIDNEGIPVDDEFVFEILSSKLLRPDSVTDFFFAR